MRFSKFEVIKTKENYYFLEWDVYADNDPESVDDYNFEIYWSSDPENGFLAVQDANGDPIVVDGAVGPLTYTHPYAQYDFNMVRYYKIKMTNKAQPDIESFSELVFIGKYNDGIHEVMKHNEEMLYNNYSGEPTIVIKRKSTGTRCTECWSSSRQQRVKSHCETCNGTGFLIGYYQPIHIQVAYDSDPKASDLGKEGENVFDSKRARMSNFPLVRPKDLLINTDDYKRYVIVRVETTKLPNLSKDRHTLSRQNYIISQIMTLEELNTDDNEYQMDIDNIPLPGPDEEGHTGAPPQYVGHKPATADPPLEVDANQKITFNYSSDDFELVDGVFTLKDGAIGVETIVAAEVFGLPLKGVALDDSGQGIIVDVSDVDHIDRVVGIALNASGAGGNLTVRKFGKISNSTWAWEMGKRIFIDASGDLTQVPSVSPGFWVPVAQPTSSTTVDVKVMMPVIRH